MPDYRNNENPPATKCDNEVALAAGAAIGKAHAPFAEQTEEGTASYAVVPKGYELKSLEEFLPRPLRVREEVALQDADSFIVYVNDFKTTPASRIFFNSPEETFVAVLDYHDGDVASWCSHLATFKPRRTEEFNTWVGSNRKGMSQVDFARFLEENLPDIAEPNSAEFLQMALTFEAKKSVEFSSGVRLANGTIQFQYDEVVRGTAQKGTMEVPETFVLGIAIFDGRVPSDREGEPPKKGPYYKLPVRLRWRLDQGKVTFWYEIVRLSRALEVALDGIKQRVANETGITVLAGKRSEGE